MSKPDKKNKSVSDLETLFELLPVIHANPGIPIAQLQELTHFKSKKEFTEKLSKMILFGTPPFSPTDYLEILIEDDRVYLEFPQGLDRPLSLSSEEWVAVKNAIGDEIDSFSIHRTTTDTLKRILERISTFPVLYETADPAKNRRKRIEEAIAENLQVEFFYRTISSKESEIRRVDPWHVFRHRAVHYMIGFCHMRQSPRFFHLDRMEKITLLAVERETAPPANLGELLRTSPIFNRQSAGFRVEIIFNPALRRPLEASFVMSEVSPFGTDDPRFAGWLRATCKVREGIWFRSMIRSFGTEVAILAPEHMRKSFLEELEAMPPVTQ